MLNYLNFNNTIYILLPYIYLIYSIIFLLIFGIFQSFKKDSIKIIIHYIYFLSLLILIFFFYLLNKNIFINVYIFDLSIILSYFELFGFKLLCILLFIIFLISYRYIIYEKINNFEYPIFLLLLLYS